MGYTTQCTSHAALVQGGTINFKVAGYTDPGTGQTIPATATAVVFNLTAINDSQGTYLTAYPTGGAVPLASNVNAAAGQILPNLVTVDVGTGGQVSVYNAIGVVDFAADIAGYYDPSGSTNDGTFHPVSPVRACDTRGGQGTLCNSGSNNPLGQNSVRAVQIWGGSTGIPINGTAEAAVVNLTAVGGSAGTFMSIFPPSPSTHTCSAAVPNFSNVNPAAGTNVANRVTVPIDPTNGEICVYNAVGTINFIVDVNGWYGNGSETSLGAHFYAMPPHRICDTRPSATLCSGSRLGAGSSLTVQVDGQGFIPSSGVTGLVANATAVSGSTFTYLALYPHGGSVPATSDINVVPGQILANMVIVAVPAGGQINIFNSQGNIDAIVDTLGWFA